MSAPAPAPSRSSGAGPRAAPVRSRSSTRGPLRHDRRERAPARGGARRGRRGRVPDALEGLPARTRSSSRRDVPARPDRPTVGGPAARRTARRRRRHARVERALSEAHARLGGRWLGCSTTMPMRSVASPPGSRSARSCSGRWRSPPPMRTPRRSPCRRRQRRAPREPHERGDRALHRGRAGRRRSAHAARRGDPGREPVCASMRARSCRPPCSTTARPARGSSTRRTSRSTRSPRRWSAPRAPVRMSPGCIPATSRSTPPSPSRCAGSMRPACRGR